MKKIFISGVSSGIGLCTAMHLVNNGYYVIGTVRREEDAQTCLLKMPYSFTPILIDLTQPSDIEKMVVRIKEILKGDLLFAIIHNAGVAVPGALSDLNTEDWDYQMNINVKAVFEVTNALLPLMTLDPNLKNNRRVIIHISSISGLINMPLNGAYCISKHALESMSDIYRRELIQFGIQVTCIEPGPIKTPIWQKTKKLNLGTKYKESPYLNLYSKTNEALDQYEKDALPPQKIADLVLSILMGQKRSARYIVHTHRLGMKLISMLPDLILDKIIQRQLKKIGN